MLSWGAHQTSVTLSYLMLSMRLFPQWLSSQFKHSIQSVWRDLIKTPRSSELWGRAPLILELPYDVRPCSYPQRTAPDQDPLARQRRTSHMRSCPRCQEAGSFLALSAPLLLGASGPRFPVRQLPAGSAEGGCLHLLWRDFGICGCECASVDLIPASRGAAACTEACC